MYESIEMYRSQAIEAAKDLFYGSEVIRRLEEAKTQTEIEMIMAAARHDSFK